MVLLVDTIQVTFTEVHIHTLAYRATCEQSLMKNAQSCNQQQESTRMNFNGYGSFIVLLLACQCLIEPITAFASFDSVVNCGPHPTNPSKEVCVTAFTFYSPTPSGPDGSYEGSWSWSYTFVEGLEEGTDTSLMPYAELEPFVVGRANVYLNEDQATCRISGCQSCTLCELGDWSGEQQNARFKADCTSAPKISPLVNFGRSRTIEK
jgi:hypothetical protein